MLEQQIKELKEEKEKAVSDNEDLKKDLDKMKREDNLKKNEIKKLKEENRKLNLEIGKIQFDKDKVEAKVKSNEKLKKIKKNTELFNKIIEKQLNDGEIVDIDISIYQKNDMEECDGGEISRKTTGYGPNDLKSLVRNKEMGGRRTSPQENTQNKNKSILKCPQCDFMSQKQTVFNDHMTKVHAGKPNCPFCFLGFKDFPALRKHCESSHQEVNKDNQQSKLPANKKRPCRFFKNGERRCMPRS